MQRRISFAADNFYHVFNRGVEKRKIFLGAKDYERFLRLLFFCNGSAPVNIRELIKMGLYKGPSFVEFERGNQMVDIGAYCLMPNHFHLLLKEKVDNGITDFMRKLCTAYPMYFNKKYERVGPLFQGRFGAQHLNQDVYLKYIFAYIHLNPLKLCDLFWQEDDYFKKAKNLRNAEDFLKKYTWSSYRNYIESENDDYILNIDAFPKYFENSKQFKSFIKDWLSFTKVRPWEDL